MKIQKLFFFNSIDWAKNQIIEQHNHSCYEIVYYQKANGYTNVNSKILEFSTNNFCIIPPNYPHSEVHFIEGNTLFIGFTDDSLNLDKPIMLTDDNNLIVKKLMNRIYQEALEQKDNYLDMISLLLKEIIIHVKRKPSNAQQSKKAHDLSLIMAYISENYSFKITIEQLLSITHYSEGHLRRLFKQQFGTSPQNYIIDFRLKKAAEFLKNKNISCTDVALSCGFTDSAQFSKMFKNKFGLSPKKYQLTN